MLIKHIGIRYVRCCLRSLALFPSLLLCFPISSWIKSTLRMSLFHRRKTGHSAEAPLSITPVHSNNNTSIPFFSPLLGRTIESRRCRLPDQLVAYPKSGHSQMRFFQSPLLPRRQAAFAFHRKKSYCSLRENDYKLLSYPNCREEENERRKVGEAAPCSLRKEVTKSVQTCKAFLSLPNCLHMSTGKRKNQEAIKFGIRKMIRNKVRGKKIRHLCRSSSHRKKLKIFDFNWIFLLLCFSSSGVLPWSSNRANEN